MGLIGGLNYLLAPSNINVMLSACIICSCITEPEAVNWNGRSGPGFSNPMFTIIRSEVHPNHYNFATKAGTGRLIGYSLTVLYCRYKTHDTG